MPLVPARLAGAQELMMNAHDVSILDEGASLSGRLTGQDLMIAGSFEGELTLSGRLTLGPGARVKAKVRAEVVEIEGHFDGEIRASNRKEGGAEMVIELPRYHPENALLHV